MPPFMSGLRAVSSLLSCRNAISRKLVSRSGIPRGSFVSDQIRRFGSLSGVERCSSNWLMSNDDARVSFRRLPGSVSLLQRRHFLGCGDGEEGGGELSKIYEERRVLGYTPEQMFNVVAAVDLYHGFVPWCQRSEVLKEYPDGSFDAELEIGFKFLVESYISHVESERPKWIKTTARDTGLFDHLINLWQFKPGPIPGTCDLHFHVDFKFNSPLYRQVKKLLCKTSAPKSQTVCKWCYGIVRIQRNPQEKI